MQFKICLFALIFVASASASAVESVDRNEDEIALAAFINDLNDRGFIDFLTSTIAKISGAIKSPIGQAIIAALKAAAPVIMKSG